MNVTCPHCQAQTTINTAHRALASARCHECHQVIESQRQIAPEAKAARRDEELAPDANQALRLLLEALQRGAGVEASVSNPPPSKNAEATRALVCVAAPHNEAIANRLAESGYEASIVNNPTEVVASIRADHAEVVFIDAGTTGAIDAPIDPATIMPEWSSLRPVERRRIFVVQVSATARTGDAHAAFVSHVNLVFNHHDILKLPQVLERALFHYRELYHGFNRAIDARVAATFAVR